MMLSREYLSSVNFLATSSISKFRSHQFPTAPPRHSRVPWSTTFHSLSRSMHRAFKRVSLQPLPQFSSARDELLVELFTEVLFQNTGCGGIKCPEQEPILFLYCLACGREGRTHYGSQTLNVIWTRQVSFVKTGRKRNIFRHNPEGKEAETEVFVRLTNLGKFL